MRPFWRGFVVGYALMTAAFVVVGGAALIIVAIGYALT